MKTKLRPQFYGQPGPFEMNQPVGDYVHGTGYKMMRLKMLVCGHAGPTEEEWASGLGKLLDHLEANPLKD